MKPLEGESFLPLAGDVTGPSGTGQIKTGAPCRSERLAKYNQLWLVGLWWFLGKDVTGEMNMGGSFSAFLFFTFSMEMFRKVVKEAKNLSSP